MTRHGMRCLAAACDHSSAHHTHRPPQAPCARRAAHVRAGIVRDCARITSAYTTAPDWAPNCPVVTFRQ